MASPLRSISRSAKRAAAWGRRVGLLPPDIPGMGSAEEKSLNDQQLSGDMDGLGVRVHVGVVSLGGKTTQAQTKRNVATLRRWAEHSIWVRAALDIYRDSVARAEWQLKPADRKRPMNPTAEREIRALLKRPNKSGTPYKALKEMFVEDCLVLGHGALEMGIRGDTRPWGFWPMDAQRLGFIRGWDGSDPSLPRYIEMAANGQPRRALPDAMVMCLINRPRSYDMLGLSHVEVLDQVVRALLAHDKNLKKQFEQPVPSGALNLGTGATKAQVDQVRAEMNEVEKPFIIMGGTDGMSYVRFDATASQLRALDQCEWFVRQVAAVFQISTAKLRLAVDTSRANTEAMFDDDLRGPAALLQRIQELEQTCIVDRWGDSSNIAIDYPIMSHKDEGEQATIGVQALGSQPWRSINEVRRATGDEEVDHPLAREVLIEMGGELYTFDQLQERMDAREKEPTTPPPGTQPGGGAAQGNGAPQGAADEEAATSKGLTPATWTAEELQAATMREAGDGERALAYLRSVAPELASLFSARA